MKKGYDVTALDLNEDFCEVLRKKFPNEMVLQKDVRNFNVDERYDVVTCIELVQNRDKNNLLDLLKTLGVDKIAAN